MAKDIFAQDNPKDPDNRHRIGEVVSIIHSDPKLNNRLKAMGRKMVSETKIREYIQPVAPAYATRPGRPKGG